MNNMLVEYVALSTMPKQVEIANQKLDIELETGKVSLEKTKSMAKMEIDLFSQLNDEETVKLNKVDSKLKKLMSIRESMVKLSKDVTAIDTQIDTLIASIK